MTVLASVPTGCAIVERIGWDDDGRFTASLVFPNGPPALPVAVIWNAVPVHLVVERQGLEAVT